MASLGDNIAALRREKGLTQAQLGDELCVSAQAVSKWERNLSQPDIATIRKMAALFDITIESLLDEERYDEEEEHDEDEESDEDGEEQDDEEEEKKSTKVVAMCMTCGKMCEENDVQQVNGKMMCSSCYKSLQLKQKQLEAERKRKEEEERRKKEQEMIAVERQRRYAAEKRLKTPLIWAGAITGIWLIADIILCVNLYSELTLAFGIISLYIVFSIVYEFALSGSILRRVCGVMFRKPGPNERGRGCSCLMFLLFGFLYVLIGLIIIMITAFVAAVGFPIDLHKCIRAAK